MEQENRHVKPSVLKQREVFLEENHAAINEEHRRMIEINREKMNMKENQLVVKNQKRNKKPNKNKPFHFGKNMWKDIRIYFVSIMFLVMLWFMYLIWDFNVVPFKYLLPIDLVLILIGCGLVWVQFSKKINMFNRILGKLMMVIISVVLCVGCVFILQADEAITKITIKPGDKEYEIISVVVLKENKAEKLDDVKDGVFAIPDKIDQEHTKTAIKEINKELNSEVITKSYANTNDQAKALMEKEADAMILNESYRSLLDEKYPSFEKDTKIIHTVKIEKEVKKIGNKVDVNSTPYHVYISGIDTYGPIATNSRSDVNMIASINPTTHQILLTSIPRDYYIAQTCQGNQKDKLTHSGIFGIGCTVESMEQFTGLKINYYVRVNFSSLESIVDAIGGIDIYNQFAFYSGVDGELIPGGNIHVYGNTALKFARERHAYAEGDVQRGRNQMIVLEAIVQKAISPAIITGYSGIMSAVGNNFQTNMSEEEILSIIKRQLEEGGDWNISQQNVIGSGGTDWTPANGFNAYVMYPDLTSVDNALTNIQAVVDGKNIQP